MIVIGASVMLVSATLVQMQVSPWVTVPLLIVGFVIGVADWRRVMRKPDST